jgi:capsular polysaccharide export protein
MERDLPSKIDARSQRVFLFLQGPSSTVFSRIADHLEAAGCRAIRINLNLGDWIFWRRSGAFNYRGSPEAWPGYIRDLIDKQCVTDIILLGEERPYHRAAIQEAYASGAAIYAVEMGYLRPDWVTLEREGLSSNSRFPTDAAHIVRVSENLPEPDWKRRFSHTFFAEAVSDLLYYLPTVFFWFLYPHYRRHGLFHPLAEYAGWIIRLVTGSRRAKAAEASIRDIIGGDTRFMVYPLQLQTDYQLRSHSPFARQQDAIRTVLESFAANALAQMHLVIKIHPLDNGLISWHRCIDEISSSLGVAGRVHFIDGGNLETLTAASEGMITVNSSAALSALQAGKPVKTLGVAVYDIEGLTDNRPLQYFWNDPMPPSPKIRDAFFKLLAASIQVRGNFYSHAGVESAASEIAGRLLSRTVNLPDAYIDPAPRRRPKSVQE